MSEKFKKEKNKLDEIVYSRGGFLSEVDHEYDDAVVDLINAFATFHKSAYLVSAYPKKIKRIKSPVKSFNGINEFKFIAKDKKTADYIIKKARINNSELFDEVLDGKIEAEYLMWT